MRISLVSTRLLALASLLAWHVAAAFHQRPSDIEIKKTLLRTAAKDGRYVSRMLQTEGLFGEAEVTPSDGANTEYHVFTLIDPTTCIPKPPSNGCDCGTSHAFLMSDTNSSSLECVQLWSDNDTFVTAVNMANKDTLMFDVRPSSTNANVINAFNTSWGVLKSQVQPFSKVINEASTDDTSFNIIIVGTPNGAKATASNDLRSNVTDSTIPDFPMAICRAWVNPKNKSKWIPISDSNIQAYSDPNVQFRYSPINSREFVMKNREIDEYGKQKKYWEFASSTIKEFAGAISAAATGGAVSTPPWYMTLGLNIYSLVLGLQEPENPLADFLIESFETINENIFKLSQLVNDLVLEIRKDIADTTLDEFMIHLQSIDFAYQKLIKAAKAPDNVKALYRESYRAACNVPHFTPEDIIRNLYGYACGDATKDTPRTDCTITQTKNRGTCSYGRKKRNDIFFLYVEDSQKLTNPLNIFKDWLLRSMWLAFFHFQACLPPESASCNVKIEDPVYIQTTNDLALAISEVVDNFDRVEHCFLDNFRDALTDKFISQITNLNDCLASDDVKKNEGNAELAELKEQEINVCLSKQIFGYINNPQQPQFNRFYWSIAVFSFLDEDEENAFNKDGSRCTVDYHEGSTDVPNRGSRMVPRVEYSDKKKRYFFFIYVSKTLFDQKGFTATKDLQAFKDLNVLPFFHG